MKMKKFLASILAVVFILPVFSLCACTDEPRVLNDVEKKLVGKWRDPYGSFTFYEDGTYYVNGYTGTFTCDQKLKTDDTFGAYYLVITEGLSHYFAFSAGYDKLCGTDKDGGFTYGYSDYYYRVDEE